MKKKLRTRTLLPISKEMCPVFVALTSLITVQNCPWHRCGQNTARLLSHLLRLILYNSTFLKTIFPVIIIVYRFGPVSWVPCISYAFMVYILKHCQGHNGHKNKVISPKQRSRKTTKI